VVLERGKRLEAKSKVDETEKERAWVSGRLRGAAAAAGLWESRGSSRSREARREEDMLGREEMSSASEPPPELASDASSSESRAVGGRLE
jgi:hypothetical protein